MKNITDNNNNILWEINGETILPLVLFGDNRSSELLDWQKKVFDKFGLVLNYCRCPFPANSHGFYLNTILSSIMLQEKRPDYILFIENDALFLKDDCVEYIYGIIKNKETIFGLAHQSNHKKGPNGSFQHVYASPSILAFSTELYEKLGRPTMDGHLDRSDTAEEFTYIAKEAGYTVAISYPSHVVKANCDLDNGLKFGMGNTYGNRFYHAMQYSEESIQHFIKKCQTVLQTS